MNTTTTEERRVPVIVESVDAFTETLFKPINGRTADGYVIKRTKRNCTIFIAGQTIVVNRWLVDCKARKHDDGTTRYTFASLPFSLCALREAFHKLTVGHDWNAKGETQYIFKR